MIPTNVHSKPVGSVAVPAPQPSIGPVPGHPVVGSMNGVPVAQVHKAAPVTAPSWHAQPGAPFQAAESKRLSERKVRREGVVPPMQSAQIVHHSQLNNLGIAARQTGLHFLRHGTWPSLPQGRRGAMQKFLALQSAAAYLGDGDDDEDDGLALLLPVAGLPGNAKDLSDYLKEKWQDDPEELAQLLKDVEGLPKNPALYEALKDALEDPDPRKLIGQLKKLLGLPQDRTARNELREQISDELHSMALGTSPEGR